MQTWTVLGSNLLLKIWKVGFKLSTILSMIPNQRLPNLARLLSSMTAGLKNVWMTNWFHLISGM
jgi:hypothetical protein